MIAIATKSTNQTSMALLSPLTSLTSHQEDPSDSNSTGLSCLRGDVNAHGCTHTPLMIQLLILNLLTSVPQTYPVPNSC